MATILVEILGNAKQFKSELDGAVASTEKANSGFGKMTKAAGVAGLAIGGGLAFGLVKSVEAADAMQQATARMNTAFAASHVPVKKFAGAIEEAEGKGRKLGFSNEEVRGSLGSLIIATHNGRKAISDLSVAQDIARFKHVSLETATKTLTMAMAGSQRAVKQLGINVMKSTEATDAAKESYKKNLDALKAQFPATAKQTAAEHELYLKKKNALDLSYASDKATSKTIDLHATAARVIATVSEKLHGQSDAYSKTAAGGMAAFHAQLGDVEEKLGTALLPALTAVAQELSSLSVFFSENMGITKKVVVGLAALAAVLLTVSAVTKIVAATQAIISGATAAWTAAQWLLNAALTANPIGIVIVAVAALAAGLVIAYQRSATFRSIVTGALDAVSAAANTVLDFFKSNWPLIAVLISGPFAPLVALATNAFGIRSALVGAFNDIKSGISRALSTIVSWVSGLPGRIKGALGDLSKLLYTAGVSVIQGLYDGMTSKVKDVYNLAGNIAGKISDLKGPIDKDKVLLVPHGQAIIEGLLLGLNNGLSNLPGTLSAGVQKALDAGRATIEAAQASFQAAWSQIASDADKAFDGITGAIQTKAEKALSAAQAAHDKAGRDQALATAQGALTTAQAGGDPAAILAAEQQLAEAKYAIHIAALQKEAATQRLNLDARNALEKRHFDAALANLQEHLAKGHASYKEAHSEILKLFKTFGVNYSDAGSDLGKAFVTGLKESIEAATKQSGSLSGKLKDVAAGIHIPKADTGGFVTQSGLAIIHKGETITKASDVAKQSSSGAGGGGNTFIVNNTTQLDERAIARAWIWQSKHVVT